MKLFHCHVVVLGALVLAMIVSVCGQGNVLPAAYIPPSKSCARVSYGHHYCGGLSAGNQGGCDSFCLQQGYPLSYCRPDHCFCHRGQDLGRECERIGACPNCVGKK